jgi:hypothetical protein
MNVLFLSLSSFNLFLPLFTQLLFVNPIMNTILALAIYRISYYNKCNSKEKIPILKLKLLAYLLDSPIHFVPYLHYVAHYNFTRLETSKFQHLPSQPLRTLHPGIRSGVDDIVDTPVSQLG